MKILTFLSLSLPSPPFTHSLTHSLSLSPVLEPFSLTLYTWFMERDHHDNLRLKGHTELVASLPPNMAYSLPVHALIFHESSRDSVKCTLQRPYTATPTSLDTTESGPNVAHLGPHLTRVMFKLGATPDKGGTYNISCIGSYYYPLDNKWFPVQASKAITIRFIECKNV